MAFYDSPEHDLARYLEGATVAPGESVIDVPIPSNQIYIGAMLPDDDLPAAANGVQVVLRGQLGTANPKWMRDEWRIEVLSGGISRDKYRDAETLINNVVRTLIGSKTIYIGDRAYVHITSNLLPYFVGYNEGTKPLFRSTVEFVLEGLTDEFHREALPE